MIRTTAKRFCLPVSAAVFVFLLNLTFFVPTLGAQSDPQSITVTGFVTCSMCLIPGFCRSQSRFGCTQWWIPQGSNYVLVEGDKHHILAGMERDLAEAAKESSVTISGELVSIPRFTELMRPGSLLDLFRPKTELKVSSVTWPKHKRHGDRSPRPVTRS